MEYLAKLGIIFTNIGLAIGALFFIVFYGLAYSVYFGYVIGVSCFCC